jgi:hypothetical protein
VQIGVLEVGETEYNGLSWAGLAVEWIDASPCHLPLIAAQGIMYLPDLYVKITLCDRKFIDNCLTYTKSATRTPIQLVPADNKSKKRRFVSTQTLLLSLKPSRPVPRTLSQLFFQLQQLFNSKWWAQCWKISMSPWDQWRHVCTMFEVRVSN